MDFQPCDAIFLAIVIWLAVQILSNGGGGGYRARA
jgi:hypothetical protein